MVQDPGEYRWSIYQINGLGKVSSLCTPHREYMSLGRTAPEQQKNYRQFLPVCRGGVIEGNKDQYPAVNGDRQ